MFIEVEECRMMKGKIMKLLVPFFLFATVGVQAEQIKVPSLEVLKSRFELFQSAHSGEGSIVRALLEESGFLVEMADKELDSAYVANRLRMVAVAFNAGEFFFENNCSFLLSTGVPIGKARADSSVAGKREVIRILNLKVVEDSVLGKTLFRQFVEQNGLRADYDYSVAKLYSVFFKDYPKVLAEELAKLSSK